MAATAPAPGLNVIALISGGKDSFFSLLHCLANGHRVVALANLHPPPPTTTTTTGDHDDEAEADLNSFMYQTVGHEVIPLYADATGIPLYRRAITGGGAVQSGKDYSYPSPSSTPTPTPTAADADADETECMVPLLRAVLAAHPEADALCAGAVLSTYQRTRVESVAVRLGLVPLAFLWKFPVLPVPVEGAGDGDGDGDVQLLRDMAAAGVEPRIVKVASGGLDESFLWEDAAGPRGVARLRGAMRRFGVAGQGAVIGEGGEFETLVVDGPPGLFRKRIVVEEADRRVVREGGGTAWLSVRRARVEEKGAGEERSYAPPRIPDLLDARFASILASLDGPDETGMLADDATPLPGRPLLDAVHSSGPPTLRQWCVVGDAPSPPSIEAETASLVAKITALLRQASPPAPPSSSSILSTVIVLRHMSDFPAVNAVYGALFAGAPNPPSRVTVSCGALLPPGRNIAVYLSSVHHAGAAARQGLHVQSRSYWAPANIGPYSQAISVPLSSLSASAPPSASAPALLVHIAGQIPLIPATMALPLSSSFAFSSALSLQHLWRIGADTGVRWWGSAVAYLPRTTTTAAQAQAQARLAARLWRAAHAWSPPSPSDGDEPGPDLWDRRHDRRYMTFASSAGGDGALPDRDVLLLAAEPSGHEGVATPPCFVAEVDALPRGAPVEWHAHAGFARVADRCVRVGGGGAVSGGTWWHAVVVDVAGGEEGAAGRGVFVHTVVALRPEQEGGEGEERAKAPLDKVLAELAVLYRGRVAALAGLDGAEGRAEGGGAVAPAYLYVHAGAVAVEDGDLGREGRPVVPCFSLWDAAGEEVAAVAVYQEWFDRR